MIKTSNDCFVCCSINLTSISDAVGDEVIALLSTGIFNKIVIELVDGLVGMNVDSKKVSEFCVFCV